MRKNSRTIAATAITICLTLAGCAGGNTNETTAQNQSQSGQAQAGTTEAGAPAETGSMQSPEIETTTVEATEAVGKTHKPVHPDSVTEIRAEVTSGSYLPARLTEVCQIPTPEGRNKYFSYEDYLRMEDSSDKLLYYCDYKGEKLLGGRDIQYIEKLKYSKYFVYTTPAVDGETHCGLFDAQGNELISADDGVSLIVEFIENDRYVCVYYFDGITDNEDEAVHTSATIGLHTGTAKVYDLKNRKFLESTTTKSRPAYHAHGDIVYDYMVSQEKKKLVYVTADDDKIHELDSKYSLVGEKLIIFRDYEKGISEAYDHDMNLLFTTPYEVTAMNNTSDFYYIQVPFSTDGLQGAIHYSGTLIAEPIYKRLYYTAGEIFVYTKDYNKYGILNVAGEELTEQIYEGANSTGVLGYIAATYQDGSKDLLDENGQPVIQHGHFNNNSSLNHSYLPHSSFIYYYDNTANAASIFVVSARDLTLTDIKAYDYFGGFILYDMGNKVLYDLATGSVLSEGFTKAFSAYGYIYIEKDGVTTVYECPTEIPQVILGM
jgi:hypothetical protein